MLVLRLAWKSSLTWREVSFISFFFYSLRGELECNPHDHKSRSWFPQIWAHSECKGWASPWENHFPDHGISPDFEMEPFFSSAVLRDYEGFSMQYCNSHFNNSRVRNHRQKFKYFLCLRDLLNQWIKLFKSLLKRKLFPQGKPKGQVFQEGTGQGFKFFWKAESCHEAQVNLHLVVILLPELLEG